MGKNLAQYYKPWKQIKEENKPVLNAFADDFKQAYGQVDKNMKNFCVKKDDNAIKRLMILRRDTYNQEIQLYNKLGIEEPYPSREALIISKTFHEALVKKLYGNYVDLMNELAGPAGQEAIRNIVKQIDMTTAIGNNIYTLFREKCFDELKKMVTEKRGERTIINPINIRSSNGTAKKKTVYVDIQGLYKEVMKKYLNIEEAEYSGKLKEVMKNSLEVQIGNIITYQRDSSGKVKQLKNRNDGERGGFKILKEGTEIFFNETIIIDGDSEKVIGQLIEEIKISIKAKNNGTETEKIETAAQLFKTVLNTLGSSNQDLIDRVNKEEEKFNNKENVESFYSELQRAFETMVKKIPELNSIKQDVEELENEENQKNIQEKLVDAAEKLNKLIDNNKKKIDIEVYINNSDRKKGLEDLKAAIIKKTEGKIQGFYSSLKGSIGEAIFTLLLKMALTDGKAEVMGTQKNKLGQSSHVDVTYAAQDLKKVLGFQIKFYTGDSVSLYSENEGYSLGETSIDRYINKKSLNDYRLLAAVGPYGWEGNQFFEDLYPDIYDKNSTFFFMRYLENFMRIKDIYQGDLAGANKVLNNFFIINFKIIPTSVIISNIIKDIEEQSYFTKINIPSYLQKTTGYSLNDYKVKYNGFKVNLNSVIQ